jgi:hypothetical protein
MEKVLKSFKEYVNESFIIKDDVLSFDYSNTESTKMGKRIVMEPYKKGGKSTGGIDVYSVYNVHNQIDVIKSIKGKGPYTISSEDYQQFLKRTDLYISSKIIKSHKISTIITPKSSSGILNDLIVLLKKRNPHIKFLPETLIKVIDPNQIKIDYDHPKITDKISKRLEGIIRAAVKNKYFEIKKVDKRFAQFVSGYFESKDNVKFEDDDNIMILDDVVSSGSTFTEIHNIIKGYRYNNVIGTTIFKT